MAVSSLPSPYGIGTLGKAAYDFADFLKDAGQSYWQMLPLGPTSYGDSPYQSFSAYAGNPYFIDPDMLAADGLLTAAECAAPDWGSDPRHVDYGKIYESRFTLLHKAYKRGWERDAGAVAAFTAENERWLPDYALYMACKRHFGMKSWTEWPDDDLRLRKNEAVLDKYRTLLREDVQFFTYLQFLFFRQWTALRDYVHQQGIRIIGDLPIYVAMDSADVWAEPQFFQLDDDLVPKAVAGVPPDYFTADGQLWGNPLYDWDAMRDDGFGWWIRRIDGAGKLYDVIRIDHFRGFDTYWAIPATSTTARTGKWENGPGMELFDALEAALGKLPIIAEDLGELFPSVRKLLADSTFPGMKVLQFAFGGGDNEYLPHNHVKNGVVYPGTHDNTTLTDWWENGASEKEKATAAAYLHLTSCKPTAKEVAAVKTAAARTALLRAALGSVADRAIIPMYDWLGLGAEAHLNTPGKLGGNWAWRAKAGFDSKTLAAQIKAECAVYCRCNADVQNVKELAI